MEINGKTAVVTGPTSGIGLAITEMLLSAGARVIGLARNKDRLLALATKHGASFTGVPLDVSDYTAVSAWAETLNHPVHILINNAGIGLWKKLEHTTFAEWHRVQSTNVDGVFSVTHALLPKMLAADGIKHIISISSVAGLIGNAELTAYNASKFAVRGFSEALMKELRPQGIKVSCIYPGSVQTPFFDALGMKASANALLPEDIADAVKYLLETPDHVLVDELVIRPRNP
jgi:NADP-dependent 3-hydroxy acid dehydrogenase YdfG